MCTIARSEYSGNRAIPETHWTRCHRYFTALIRDGKYFITRPYLYQTQDITDEMAGRLNEGAFWLFVLYDSSGDLRRGNKSVAIAHSCGRLLYIGRNHCFWNKRNSRQVSIIEIAKYVPQRWICTFGARRLLSGVVSIFFTLAKSIYFVFSIWHFIIILFVVHLLCIL